MDNASLKMIKIGKVIAIIEIVLFSLMAIIFAFHLATGDDSGIDYYVFGIAVTTLSPIFLLCYSLFGVAVSVALIILGGRASTLVEYSNTSGIGYLIALMILGFNYSILYFLGGLFGLIYLGDLKKLGL